VRVGTRYPVDRARSDAYIGSLGSMTLWLISGTPDPGWDDDDLDQLKAIPARALEAVVTGPVRPG
jgi:hypothetical protein